MWSISLGTVGYGNGAAGTEGLFLIFLLFSVEGSMLNSSSGDLTLYPHAMSSRSSMATAATAMAGSFHTRGSGAMTSDKKSPADAPHISSGRSTIPERVSVAARRGVTSQKGSTIRAS